MVEPDPEGVLLEGVGVAAEDATVLVFASADVVGVIVRMRAVDSLTPQSNEKAMSTPEGI